MRQVTDQLGKGIDPGIFESVVVLNALKFSTQQSCEGHLDHGKPAPWITIISPDAIGPSREAARLFTRGEKIEEEQGKEAAQLVYAQANRCKRSAEALHSQDQRRLMEYLATFYTSYRPAYDRMLVVYTRMPACSILESLGATALASEPLHIQEQKLKDYQDEIHAFTAFLQERYFSEVEVPS